MPDEQSIKDTLNKLFNKPKPITIGEGDGAVTLYVKPATEEMHFEYSRLITSEKPKDAVRFLISETLQDADGNRVYGSPEEVDLPVGMNDLARDIISCTFGITALKGILSESSDRVM